MQCVCPCGDISRISSAYTVQPTVLMKYKARYTGVSKKGVLKIRVYQLCKTFVSVKE